MYNDELYEHLLQNQSGYQCSFSAITKTLVVCGALLLNTSASKTRASLPFHNSGSDGYVVNHIYSPDSPTWSDVEAAYFLIEDTNNDIPEAIYFLNRLAFLEGDAVAEKEADQFFNQVQIKTKKIIVRNKV